MVTSEGILVPEDRARTMGHAGKRVFVSVHQKPYFQRGLKSNAYLWLIYNAIGEATGNDADSVHQALKREAVRVGILEAQYILSGSQLLEVEPTTVVEQEQFARYVDWIKAGCMHGNLVGMRIELPEVE